MTHLATEPRMTARRAQTRERLMTAAISVFAARGIIGASVEEICEAAGFTRGAFYSNFADKDALVLELIRADMDSQLEAAEQAIATAKNAPVHLAPAERVSYALTEFEATGLRGPEAVMVQHELMLYAARQPQLREPHQAFVDLCQQRFHELITDAMLFSQLEFTVPMASAFELLAATHAHMRLQSLFTGSLDSTLMHTLLMAITRPSGP